MRVHFRDEARCECFSSDRGICLCFISAFLIIALDFSVYLRLNGTKREVTEGSLEPHLIKVVRQSLVTQDKNLN